MSRKRKFVPTSIHHIPADAVEGNFRAIIGYADEMSNDGRHIRRQDHLYYTPPSIPDAPVPAIAWADNSLDFDTREEQQELAGREGDYTEEPPTRQFTSSVSYSSVCSHMLIYSLPLQARYSLP